MLLARLSVSLSGLPVGWILLRDPPRRLLLLSRMFGMFAGMSLGWFLRRFVFLSGMLPLGLLLTIFGLFGVGVPNWVYFGPTLEQVVPLKLAVPTFLVEVCYVFVVGVWEVELLAAGFK